MNLKQVFFWLSACGVVAVPRMLHAQKLEVGNFSASTPYGITMLVDRGSAVVMTPDPDCGSSWNVPDGKDEALLPYAICAPDGSFTRADMTIGGKPLTIRFGLINDYCAGVELSSTENMSLPLYWKQPFVGCRTQYYSRDGILRIYAVAGNTGKVTLLKATASDPLDLHAANEPETTTQCTVRQDKPTVIAITLDGYEAPSFAEISAALDRAEKAYADTQVCSEGDWGNFMGAITKAMNSSRVFSSIDRRIAQTIGRGWWIRHHFQKFVTDDTMPYFTWDAFFGSSMAALEDTVAAHATVRAVLSYQLPDGMVPNYSHWPCDGYYITAQKTNPPIGAMNVWKLHERYPDLAFLGEVYPKLVKWHDWFKVGRARKGQMLLSWGNNHGNAWHANLESGWDDTPAFEGAVLEDDLLNVYCVDLSSLWAADAEYLEKMALALGKKEDAARFRKEHADMVREINEKLWNPELGIYCNRYWADAEDGTPRFQTRITPMNFYPLICGAPDAKRAKKVLRWAHDPKKFWGEYPMPTLPYDDPDWHKQTYWKGHIWGPVSYLVWQGLLRYDDAEHLSQYADRSVRLFMNGWNLPIQACAENYNSTDGSVGDDPHYTWGALLPLLGLEYLVDVDDNLEPVARKVDFKGNLSLYRIPFGGRLYDISCKDGKVTVRRSE